MVLEHMFPLREYREKTTGLSGASQNICLILLDVQQCLEGKAFKHDLRPFCIEPPMKCSHDPSNATNLCTVFALICMSLGQYNWETVAPVSTEKTVHVSMVDMLCSGTMPTHKGGQARRATHHFSLFNPLRRAQKRELTKRQWKERGGSNGRYSLLLQHCFRGSFRLQTLILLHNKRGILDARSPNNLSGKNITLRLRVCYFCSSYNLLAVIFVNTNQLIRDTVSNKVIISLGAQKSFELASKPDMSNLALL